MLLFVAAVARGGCRIGAGDGEVRTTTTTGEEDGEGTWLVERLNRVRRLIEVAEGGVYDPLL